MLFDVDIDQAVAIADRVRRSVHKLSIEHRDSLTSATITISIGIASSNPPPSERLTAPCTSQIKRSTPRR